MPVPQSLIDALWPKDLSPRMSVWAIVDGARDDSIYGAVDDCRSNKCCLHAGDLPWQMKMTAPYLVELDLQSRFTRYLLDKGWGASWGVFLRSDASIQVLRRHLRGFLKVRDEAGRNLIFRYYDPRVLRVYLPTCWPNELATVFGPIDRFLMEGEEPDVLWDFAFDGRKLTQREIRLEIPRVNAV